MFLIDEDTSQGNHGTPNQDQEQAAKVPRWTVSSPATPAWFPSAWLPSVDKPVSSPALSPSKTRYTRAPSPAVTTTVAPPRAASSPPHDASSPPPDASPPAVATSNPKVPSPTPAAQKLSLSSSPAHAASFPTVAESTPLVPSSPATTQSAEVSVTAYCEDDSADDVEEDEVDDDDSAEVDAEDEADDDGNMAEVNVTAGSLRFSPTGNPTGGRNTVDLPPLLVAQVDAMVKDHDEEHEAALGGNSFAGSGCQTAHASLMAYPPVHMPTSASVLPEQMASSPALEMEKEEDEVVAGSGSARPSPSSMSHSPVLLAPSSTPLPRSPLPTAANHHPQPPFPVQAPILQPPSSIENANPLPTSSFDCGAKADFFVAHIMAAPHATLPSKYSHVGLAKVNNPSHALPLNTLLKML